MPVLGTFDVVGEPHRRQILEALRDGERTVNQLVEVLDIRQSGVSRHLRVLREAGFVEVRPVAQTRLYRLRTEPLRELDAWLEPFRHLWNERLDLLEAHLDTMEDLDDR